MFRVQQLAGKFHHMFTFPFPPFQRGLISKGERTFFYFLKKEDRRERGGVRIFLTQLCENPTPPRGRKANTIVTCSHLISAKISARKT